MPLEGIEQWMCITILTSRQLAARGLSRAILPQTLHLIFYYAESEEIKFRRVNARLLSRGLLYALEDQDFSS